MRVKKRYTITAVVILLLVITRIALPYIVKNYVNKVLEDMPGYTGHVEDVDLHIYRGAYAIDGLVLQEEDTAREGTAQKEPLLKIRRIDLSVEWKALRKGAFTGEIILENPEINFTAAKEPQPDEDVPTEEAEHWSKTVKDLMPLTVNQFKIIDGSMAYLDPHVQPVVDVHLNKLSLTATNLTNADNNTRELPSDFYATAKTSGGGALKTEGKINFLKEIPDLDMNMELTGVDLKALNDFIKAYGKIDVERGRFSLYSELKIMNGELDGYLKPFFEDLKVLNWEKDKEEDGFFKAVWEAIAGLVAEGVENQPRDQIATQVPIEGNINQPDTDTWKTIINILKNAFVEAFNKGIEGTVGQE